MRNLGTRVFAQYLLIVCTRVQHVQAQRLGQRSAGFVRSDCVVPFFAHRMASHDPPPRTLFPFDAAPDARRAADYAHLIGSVEQRAGFQTHHIVASHAAF